MLPLNQTVNQIIKKIQTPGSPEHGDPATLHLLMTIQHCLETPQQQGLDTAFDLLREHWLHSVAWCSDLSREIEKTLMLFDEMKNEQKPSID